MDRHAARFHHGRCRERDVLRDLDRARRRKGGVLGEDPLAVHSVHFHDQADVAVAGEAEMAVVAGDVGFTCDVVAGLQVVDLFAHFHDLPGELVAEDLGELGDHGLGPRVPLINVHVGTADGPHLHPDENLPRPGFGHLDVFQNRSGTGLFFQNGFHIGSPLKWDSKTEFGIRNSE